MGKSIFISTIHEDSLYIKNLKKWTSKNLIGEDVKITCETEDKRQQGYNEIRNHIKPKIEGASAVVVLVGQDTHNHDWIKVEVELANSLNKKIIVARVPGTNGAIPPILNNKEVIAFDPNSIRKALL